MLSFWFFLYPVELLALMVEPDLALFVVLDEDRLDCAIFVLEGLEYFYSVAPIISSIAAGEPCTAIENIEGELMISPLFEKKHPKARFLKISGESMNKHFQEGSYVLYDPELEIRDGDIAVVVVNRDEATVKRVYFAGDTVVLHPESTMDDVFFDRAINVKEPASPSVTFAGRVFWHTVGDREMRY